MRERQIQTALISVTDKSGLVQLASLLKEKGVKILASSGTKAHLEEEGIHAEEVSEYTGSPEILGGRVKTLHPKIHGGLLADRDNSDHLDTLEAHGIALIDLVVINLYPFVEKFRAGELSEKSFCEFIDIGGIALLRAAAKNYAHVTILTDPGQYPAAIEEIRASGGTALETRKRLARAAFELSSEYDATIAKFFHELSPNDEMPNRLPLSFKKAATLRYGENPHQRAAVYASQEDSPLLSLKQHQGKELSFNNYLDIAGAFSLARDLGKGSVAIIKHTNPCGAAWCGSPAASYRRALECDPLSAFGGIVAVNGSVGIELAAEMTKLFLEVVLARSFDAEAMKQMSKKKNLRAVTISDRFWEEAKQSRIGVCVENALLFQESDTGFPELDELKTAGHREPSASELDACKMAWKVAKHVKSNSIVIADEEGTVGIGAGQMSRVDAARIAVKKAGDAKFSLHGKVAASDAFFPFPDGVTELAQAGIVAVIQPGGSIRDKEVIAAADAADVAMIFTGRRHFRHI
ncbi:MAG: bifunctional phosphoribosylaminoimidazolecarboxamide formyltransferase/IMP cyclohydrolase [Candidatus Latescibacteria bacterium]|nr:bifunctional phosphoribosylaminoimidazolecarboxamide formyltransferase/IMP cyclohydrolase [Candidatus Latescibacterota bacterium]NIM21359.1 bifunctional phosphoribosylaminoimidazolecarboxamide formyltransferase/IMP cyclohydrolase [Candidatus Latescibacterota bacterium]NIM65540.1 bifunctional phosphoribosylaminoimidazolecarboxamide formyltransferase/IMP cyclohydrolase [Candidatus Latescibacterota bacterium]NIO01920.1 bifunctional phosphoribosylaminoimidazolecarboxamide formyltransferase/IMP cy